MFNFYIKILSFFINHWLKCANNLYRKHEYKKAIPLYKKILKYNAKHYAALCNLATSYFEDGDYKKSLPYFLQLKKTEPNNPWWHTYLSQVYQKQKSYRKALDSAWQAVKISNGESAHQVNLSYAFYEIASIKGNAFVIDLVQKFYRQYPQSGIAQQCYNAFFRAEKTVVCNREYIEKIFDIFATDFEQTLYRLQYDSPNIIANILTRICQDKRSSLNVIDLGCGTGLCGRLIKKVLPQSMIFGVDISSHMLAQADAKKVYYQLAKNDIISYLKTSKIKFDIVVASDVFTYFGELNEMFNLVFSHLKNDGIFIFTVSKNTYNHKSYFLTPASRFVHQISYIKKMLLKNGFYLQDVQEKILRKEGQKNIVGDIFTVIKK